MRISKKIDREIGHIKEKANKENPNITSKWNKRQNHFLAREIVQFHSKKHTIIQNSENQKKKLD